jgi:hypothetical protein
MVAPAVCEKGQRSAEAALLQYLWSEIRRMGDLWTNDRASSLGQPRLCTGTSLGSDTRRCERRDGIDSCRRMGRLYG